jgi:putative endonuclease
VSIRGADRAWHVYIVRTRDGSLYTGVTTNVARRMTEHRAGDGRGARYLQGRGPLEIAYRCKLGARGFALSVEWRIKRRSRADKEAIIADRPSRRALLRQLGVPGVERSRRQKVARQSSMRGA